MTRALPLVLVALLIASPVSAADSHVDYIEGVMDEAIAELTAAYDDTTTPPVCRAYIDATLTVLELVELNTRRPGSYYGPYLLGTMLPQLAATRQACQLAT